MHSPGSSPFCLQLPVVHALTLSSSYRTDGSGAPPVFPFHWCCFELLLKVLTNTTDLGRLDKELLYNVMQDLAQDDTRYLSLDYGEAGAAQSQFWESLPGQEFLVVKPAFVPLLADILPVAIGGETFKNSPQAETPVTLEARIANDPFTNMPYDILYKILCFLSFDSISNLSIASWPVHVSLRNNGGFWRQLARNSMPWFFELHGLMEDEKLMEGRNFHKLYLWLEKMTRPKPWVNESFMAVANRRRIWGVCEQLAGLYHTRMSKRANREEFGEVANLIWKHANNPQMPLVVYPQPTANTETVSTQWVRSLEELDSGVALFNAFWNDAGSLAGLSMSLSGGSQRLFGRDNAVEGVPKHTVTTKSLSEFKGLILHLKPMQIEKRGAETFIVGITVICDSTQYILGDTDEEYPQRPLLINEGKNLVGVVGHIANDKICRLGLLQFSRPPHDDFDLLRPGSPRADIPYLQRHLWKYSSRGNLGTHTGSTIPIKIWDHPSLRVIFSRDPRYSARNVPEEVLPLEALIWAKDAEELRTIKRISAYVTEGARYPGQGSTGSRSRGCITTFAEPASSTSPTASSLSGGDWEEDNMVHFEINGPGGEVVTRVEVAMHENPKAIKLFTNRGRETYWGEQKVENWRVLEVPQGETIVGLVFAFGQSSGWNNETKTNVSEVLF
ncbi:hypothetical protein GTA08_BOTSDO09438 [Neofusicoccum parvum]|uniref:Uncharacterized protein n=1 Tax=Neofusicoccum parvum TaxID=310453 RepID=A0ACB5RZB0_9PEZI|nr:hypothetical protein GTA08_BOTSDO09438 [Neofusicoccum parvum]